MYGEMTTRWRRWQRLIRNGLERLCEVEIGGFRLPREEVEAMIHRDSVKLLFG